MVCHSLPVSDDDHVHIRRLCALFAEVRAFDLAACHIFYIRRAIQSDSNYHLVRCLPDIQDTSCGDQFLDIAGPDGYTTLTTGVFYWLMSIRLGYLIFRQDDSCTIEPYLPSRFAHQFGYDQLYVGNPNTILYFSGNLEGARAWYFHVAGGTGAIFNLPQRPPNAYTSLSFCTWYIVANTVPGYEMNASCIKAIKSSYNVHRGSKTVRKKGMNEYLQAEKEAGACGVAERVT